MTTNKKDNLNSIEVVTISQNEKTIGITADKTIEAISEADTVSTTQEATTPVVSNKQKIDWEAIKTQRDRALTYMQEYGSIDKYRAYNTFEMFELPSAIYQVKKKGYQVESVPQRNSKNQKYTCYVYHGKAKDTKTEKNHKGEKQNEQHDV